MTRLLFACLDVYLAYILPVSLHVVGLHWVSMQMRNACVYTFTYILTWNQRIVALAIIQKTAFNVLIFIFARTFNRKHLVFVFCVVI